MKNRKNFAFALLAGSVVLLVMGAVLTVYRYEPTSEVVFASLQVVPTEQTGTASGPGYVFYDFKFDGRFDLGSPDTEIPPEATRQLSLVAKMACLYDDCFGPDLPNGRMSGTFLIDRCENSSLLVKPNVTYGVSLNSPLPIAQYTDYLGTQRTVYVFASA